MLARAEETHGRQGLLVAGFDRRDVRFVEVQDLDASGAAALDLAFPIASVTKLLTSYTLAALVREGRLSWDESLSAVCPSLKLSDAFKDDPPSLIDVLAHRTGLPMWAGDLLWYRTRLDWTQIAPRLRAIRPVAPIRSQLSYSNLLFSALREPFAARAGRSWDQAVSEAVLSPLGMQRTALTDDAARSLARFVAPRTKLADPSATPFVQPLDVIAPAAGARSTAGDLMRFARGVLDYRARDALFPAWAIEPMWEPYTPMPFSAERREVAPETLTQAMGLGCRVIFHAGRRIVCHFGSLPGCSTFLGFVPEEGVGLVMLSSGDDGPLLRVALFSALDDLFGLPPSDWLSRFAAIEAAEKKEAGTPHEPKPHALVEADRKALLGTYESEVYGEANLVDRDGALRLVLEHHADVGATVVGRSERGYVAEMQPAYMGRIQIAVERKGDKVQRLVTSFGPRYVDGLTYRFARTS